MKWNIFSLLFFTILIHMVALGQPSRHTLWNDLLKQHVDKSGNVDYKGFIYDKDRLEMYLDQLSLGLPNDKKITKNERLAYWINAYNAFTIKLIVDHYPIKSIIELNKTIALPNVNTIWDKKFFTIKGVSNSLNDIEHKILRKRFQEPRIHFALNCASYSCPPLRREAYEGALLESQMESQSQSFINDNKRNAISNQDVHLSMIFQWFVKDFTKKESLIDYINQYSTVKIPQHTRLKFMEYRWELNEK